MTSSVFPQGGTGRVIKSVFVEHCKVLCLLNVLHLGCSAASIVGSMACDR